MLLVEVVARRQILLLVRSQVTRWVWTGRSSPVRGNGMAVEPQMCEECSNIVQLMVDAVLRMLRWSEVEFEVAVKRDEEE